MQLYKVQILVRGVGSAAHEGRVHRFEFYQVHSGGIVMTEEQFLRSKPLYEKIQKVRKISEMLNGLEEIKQIKITYKLQGEYSSKYYDETDIDVSDIPEDLLTYLREYFNIWLKDLEKELKEI